MWARGASVVEADVVSAAIPGEGDDLVVGHAKVWLRAEVGHDALLIEPMHGERGVALVGHNVDVVKAKGVVPFCDAVEASLCGGNGLCAVAVVKCGRGYRADVVEAVGAWNGVFGAACVDVEEDAVAIRQSFAFAASVHEAVERAVVFVLGGWV